MQWLTFSLVVLTAVVALLEGSVPYYPIEISRTATGPLSYWTFAIGTCLLATLAFWGTRNYESAERGCMLVALFGFALLAIVDDVTSWTIHMIGLTFLGLGVLLWVVLYGSAADGRMLMWCAFVYVLRLVIKAAAVMHEKGKDPLSPVPWIQLMVDTPFCCAVVTRASEIMYHGDFEPDSLWTPLAFRVAGLLQWYVFWKMAGLWNERPLVFSY